MGKDLRALGLDRTEAAEVRTLIQSLKPLAKARDRPIRRAVDRKHKHDREPRPCKICKFMLPHDQKAWRIHMWRLKGRIGFKRGPIGKPGDPGPYAAREKGVQRRIQAFMEEAPHAAKVLGPEAVRAIAERVDTRQRYAYYRRWVQVHYGSGPSRRANPASLRSLDRIAGRKPLKITYPQPVYVPRPKRTKPWAPDWKKPH